MGITATSNSLLSSFMMTSNAMKFMTAMQIGCHHCFVLLTCTIVWRQPTERCTGGLAFVLYEPLQNSYNKRRMKIFKLSFAGERPVCGQQYRANNLNDDYSVADEQWWIIAAENLLRRAIGWRASSEAHRKIQSDIWVDTKVDTRVDTGRASCSNETVSCGL